LRVLCCFWFGMLLSTLVIAPLSLLVFPFRSWAIFIGLWAPLYSVVAGALLR